MKRSMQGKPVLPIITRKVPSKSGTAASWNEIIESGVIVNPRSLNIEAAVKTPLSHCQHPIRRATRYYEPPGSRLSQTINICAPSVGSYNPREKHSHSKDMEYQDIRWPKMSFRHRRLEGPTYQRGLLRES